MFPGSPTAGVVDGVADCTARSGTAAAAAVVRLVSSLLPPDTVAPEKDNVRLVAALVAKGGLCDRPRAKRTPAERVSRRSVRRGRRVAASEAGWQDVSTAQPLSGVSPRDIAFQVLDRLFMSSDDPINQIADRYHARNSLTLHHG